MVAFEARLVDFQITGLDSYAEAQELALLMRAGALAAPMYFVEERTLGPTLGAQNIESGINSLILGFVLVLGFMGELPLWLVIADDRIVAYGRSLGGGVAASLAAERPIAGLILESSFTSVRPLAARFLVPGWLVRDPFDNLAALRQYRGPLLVVHGLEDEIVPVNEGRKLAAAVAGAEIHLLECGHNDCPRPWGLMRQFLEARGLMTSTSGGKPAA